MLWRPSSDSMSHRISAARRSASGVFFNVAWRGLGGSQLQIAYLLGNRNQFLNQLAEAVIFLELFSGAIHGGARRDNARHRLASHRVGERVGRAMALLAFFGAVAGWFPALAETWDQ